jgi:P27 family predicted phage terminase small subunit
MDGHFPCWWCRVPRPEKDAALHRLQGTKSVAGKTDAEGSVEPGRPKFPKGLPPAARVVFKRIVGLLEKRRHITEGDVELIRLYSFLHVRHGKALAKLEAEGEIRTYVRLDSNGQPHDQEKPNLWLKVAQDAERGMVACLDRLGLTAMNRTKVKPTGKPDDAKPVDLMEEFLSRRAGPVDLDDEEQVQ